MWRQLLLSSHVLAYFASLFYSGAAQSETNAELTLQFHRFASDRGVLHDDRFCDPDLSGNMESECDPTFRYEIFREGEYGKFIFEATEGDHHTSDVRAVVFPLPGRIGAMENPKKLDLDLGKPGDIYLKFTVEDYDKGRENELMDIFVVRLEKSVTVQQQTVYTDLITNDKLTLSYEFKCKQNLYGRDCRKSCMPRDNDADGHYSCSSQGDVVCLTGWINPDQDCKVPAWCRWC